MIIIQLPDGSGDGRRKKNKSGEDGSYRTAQVSHGDGRRKKSKKGDGRLMCIASDFIRGPKKRGGRLSDSGHCLSTHR